VKAILSATYDDNYIFFLPIVRWCWKQTGVDAICFLPQPETDLEKKKYELVFDINNYTFRCPDSKRATYAQCSRLFAAALPFKEEEVLITSDVDMAVFGDYLKQKCADFDVFGSDLTPENQIPMCYISASAKNWREAMNIGKKNYQQCIDEQLAHEQCENMRGNLWSRDQELAYNHISSQSVFHHFRARPGTQFASNRVDRDDSYWRDRLNKEVVDAHLWRPGFEETNFLNLMELLSFFYPEQNFEWLINHKNAWISCLANA
jgi:hypothetical protein